MLKFASLTLPRGHNIEKGRGARKVKIWDWKAQAFNETGLFRGVSQLLLSMIVDWIDGHSFERYCVVEKGDLKTEAWIFIVTTSLLVQCSSSWAIYQVLWKLVIKWVYEWKLVEILLLLHKWSSKLRRSRRLFRFAVKYFLYTSTYMVHSVSGLSCLCQIIYLQGWRAKKSVKVHEGKTW